MKLTVVAKSREELELLSKKSVNTYIVGLKNYSVNYPWQLDIKEIEELINKNKDLEIFVAMNKNIMNKDLEEVERLLKELSSIKVAGVLFYDLAILSIRNRLNLNLELVWNQTHMVTNYNTCNYYLSKGVNYAYLANEITLDEMIEIKKNSKIKTFTLIVGHPIMAHSKRTLLTNYYKVCEKELKNDVHNITDEISKNSYLTKEDETGTSIIYGNIMNGISALPMMIENNFEYIVVDSSFIENNIVEEVIDIINDIMAGKDFNTLLNNANNIIGNDTCFLYKKTIYKVKRNG